MDLSQFLSFFNSGAFTDVIFKVAAIFIAIMYVLYSVIIAKQVRIMDKSLEASFNQFIFFVCSLQTTAALILLIFAIFIS
ncbi:MAG: DUF5657 family protein [Patescibacteria group bacterium]